MSPSDAADLVWPLSVGMQVSALQPFWIAMIISCWNVELLKLPSVTLTHVCGTDSHNWWGKVLPGVGVVKIFCDSDFSGWKSFRLHNPGAEAVEPDPGSSWEGHSLGVCTGFWNWSAESSEVVRPLRVPLMIRPSEKLLISEKLMSCCAEGKNGCLDLRRRASAPDGRVSAEWSRCPGSMAQRPRDIVAPLRRSSAVLRGLGGCPLVQDAGIQSQFARRRWWWGR